MAETAVDFQPIEEQKVDFQEVGGAAPKAARPNFSAAPPPPAGSGVNVQPVSRIPMPGDAGLEEQLARQPAKPLEIGQRFNLQTPPEEMETTFRKAVSGEGGYPKIVSGVKQVAQNVRPPASVTPETQAGMLKGGVEATRGAMEAATPLIIAGGVSAPLATARGLGEAYLASKGAGYVAGKAGASPGTQELVGNVAALGVGGRRILGDALLAPRTTVMEGPGVYARATEVLPKGEAPAPTNPEVIAAQKAQAHAQTDQAMRSERARAYQAIENHPELSKYPSAVDSAKAQIDQEIAQQSDQQHRAVIDAQPNQPQQQYRAGYAVGKTPDAYSATVKIGSKQVTLRIPRTPPTPPDTAMIPATPVDFQEVS